MADRDVFLNALMLMDGGSVGIALPYTVDIPDWCIHLQVMPNEDFMWDSLEGYRFVINKELEYGS